jgi:RNA polymerase sigma-70 factor (ECF subfamily)
LRRSNVRRAAAGAPAAPRPPATGEEPRAISFVGDEASWVAALARRDRGAIAAFHDRYAPDVLRILVRILGYDQELEDVLQETFVRALGSIHTLRDPSRLGAWVISVAVRSARTLLQRRHRRRWLKLLPPQEIVALDQPRCAQEPALAEALRCTYEVLARLAPDERVLFSLRFLEGMELTELAAACDVSLATVKRRLARAERRFSTIARAHPVLSEWVERGGRWAQR